MEFRTYEGSDLNDVIRLCEAERWESYVADPEQTHRALSAPGVITVVATKEGKAVGFARLLTDGAIRAYLADMVVATGERGSGVGRRLIQEIFARSNSVYIDLLSTDGSGAFYERFPHRRIPGYRLYTK